MVILSEDAKRQLPVAAGSGANSAVLVVHMGEHVISKDALLVAAAQSEGATDGKDGKDGREGAGAAEVGSRPAGVHLYLAFPDATFLPRLVLASHPLVTVQTLSHGVLAGGWPCRMAVTGPKARTVAFPPSPEDSCYPMPCPRTPQPPTRVPPSPSCMSSATPRCRQVSEGLLKQQTPAGNKASDSLITV